MPGLDSYIGRTQACGTEDALFRQFDSFVKTYGITVMSYMIVAENLRAIPLEAGMIRHSFPKAWAQTYFEHEYEKIDPVLEQIRREARPFHWFDVGQKLQLSAKQKQFLEELRDAGLVDGLAVPVFGPMNTIAHFGLGSVKAPLNLSEKEELELQHACLQTHNRYIELAKLDDPTPIKRLSPREKEVLSLVADGLSNHDIADRLNISGNTVDTLIRRIFVKLEVNNRICAVLKGIGSGVILP